MLKMNEHKVEVGDSGYRFINLETGIKSIWYIKNYDLVLDIHDNFPKGFNKFCQDMIDAEKGNVRTQ